MSTSTIWIIIIAMGIGTYLIRFSFIGLFGHRPLPAWALRLLRYTPVAVLPGVAAPLIMADEGIAGDPLRLVAAVATVGIGLWTKKLIWAVTAGFGIYFGLGALLG